MSLIRNAEELAEVLDNLPPHPAEDTCITIPVFLARRLLARIDTLTSELQEQQRELDLHREIARLRKRVQDLQA